MSARRSAPLLLRIDDVDRMPPFLMSVLSATDLWMFVASNGGLTAGRVDASHALFPYETVDRLYQRPGLGGPFTGLRIRTRDRTRMWLPFLDRDSAIETHLSKSRWGDQVRFETHHRELGLSFQYEWVPSERYGWVRRVELRNQNPSAVEVDVLDGLVDVLPAGVPLTTQQRASNLVDAYRHTEFDEASGLALFSLSSLIVDRAEPAAALRANGIWTYGLRGPVGLTADRIRTWKSDAEVKTEHHARGRKGAFLTRARLELDPDQTVRWGQVADVGLDGVRAAALRKQLIDTDDAAGAVDADVQRTHVALERLAAASDGLQDTDDGSVVTNHLANTLFNSFRGGVIVGDGAIVTSDFVDFVASRNRPVSQRHQTVLHGLPERVDLTALRQTSRQSGDVDLMRLVDEYLPIAFSRRHGDPSRPWNQFNIHTRDAQGKALLHYEGNWRDIFQNWEALALSYPAFLPSMIAKFVNAMTPDGYNPYRISRDGIDWEVPEPDDPWSNIGYWGDHQIIYLLRLLEHLEDHEPSVLHDMLVDARFSFADVPYRIVPYDDIVRNPRDTIRFDEARQSETERRSRAIGADGRLVQGPHGAVHTHLWEKLVIAVLTKLSNLVFDGGVWMNTQRPEWNDANNALAGPGLSVVTLAQTLRMVRFLRRLPLPDGLQLHAPVAEWLASVAQTLADHRPLLNTSVTPAQRRAYMDRLGRAFDRYRVQIYGPWNHDQTPVPAQAVGDWLADAESVLAEGLARNRRTDGLYHGYNILHLDEGEARVQPLSVMLEGQVGAIDSGLLNPSEVAALVDRMVESPLYAASRNSFLLYPDRTLPDLLQRNRIPEGGVQSIPLLAEDDSELVERDVDGNWRFVGHVPNADHLSLRLDELAQDPKRTERVEQDRKAVLQLYEQTFQHDAFTGRSGWMYGYEGLGCIYWHMVAKLLVGIQESFLAAVDDDPKAALSVARAYERVRSGFGFNNTDQDYGAFHTDPYSHTPGHAGAQQPGMTGQVKEQIITRLGELGVRVQKGRVNFMPRLLWAREFVQDAHTWSWIDAAGEERTVEVPAQGLAFLWAGVPVVYRASEGEGSIEVQMNDGTSRSFSGLQLDPATSRSLLHRSGTVETVRVNVPRALLRDELK